MTGIRMTLAEAARIMDGKVSGDASLSFAGVCTDTRAIQPGILFFALRGERFDGKEFAADAILQGALGSVVDEARDGFNPYIIVDDTRRALAALAAHWRSELAVRAVAVTGSNGKTTVKEMLAAVLSHAAPTHATPGNYNNNIGLPLTLLALEPRHEFAVLELGANAPGEIAELVAWAKPDVALINNAGDAHLQGFGSVRGVATAKGEILSALTGSGTAILNRDDPHFDFWRERVPGAARVLSFGVHADADFRLLSGADPVLQCRTPDGELSVNLAVPGLHNRLNACAVMAAASALHVAPAHWRAGLESFAGVKGRLQTVDLAGRGVVIDDTYNANPTSVKRAIDVLSARPERPRILVLGDLAELGDGAKAAHAALGEYARDAGIERLLTLGGMSAEAAQAFGHEAAGFTELEPLAALLQSELLPGSVALVKGSRSSRMERVIEALRTMALPNERTVN